MQEAQRSLLPEPFSRRLLGMKLFVWILASVVLLVVAFCLSIASLNVSWVWQGHPAIKWEGGLRSLDEPGTLIEMVMIVEDKGWDTDYANLANIFCDSAENDLTSMIASFYTQECNVFTDLEKAGRLYTIFVLLFIIFSFIQICTAVIALIGTKLLPRWVFVCMSSLALGCNLTALLAWTIISKAWYGQECEDNYVLEEVDICAGTGLTLAIVSNVACVLNVILFITSFIAVTTEEYYVVKLDESDVELSVN